jgi:tetratricopeptide (TPR) repeat protein
VLIETDRVEEALRLFERKKKYAERAGAGPWERLHSEGKKLQLMNKQRRFSEVLAEAETLRAQMATLSESGERAESFDPWNVREVILNAAEVAAIGSGRWEMALALVDEIMSLKSARGAAPLDLARARFSSHSPLMALRRYEETQELLADCLSVFAVEGSPGELARLFSAMAKLEHQLGHTERAILHQQAALRYDYRTGHPG